jgi:hypothetical protein
MHFGEQGIVTAERGIFAAGRGTKCRGQGERFFCWGSAHFDATGLGPDRKNPCDESSVGALPSGVSAPNPRNESEKAMSRLTVGQKANRVLRLLMGLRNPTVAAALQEHGFTDQELEEGWKRLSGLTRQRLGLRLAVENPTKVQELDDFENKWFPVARLTLERHYPALAQELFLNLSQTEGVEVVFSVSTFLERLGSMAASKPPFGSEGPAAMKLLETRGLTAERIQRAKAVLAELGTFSPAQPSAPPVAEDKEAEDALWSWYLECSPEVREASLTEHVRQSRFAGLRPQDHRAAFRDGVGAADER